MSSMLEQAIIDATALKEAAIKNAEAAIIEKYAPEVKKAVETLLEQPEEEDPLAVDPMAMDPLAAEPAADVDVDIPEGALEGHDLCPCPEKDEPVEFSIDDLRTMAAELPAGEPMPEEELMHEFEDEELQEGIEIDEELIYNLLSEEGINERDAGGMEDDCPGYFDPTTGKCHEKDSLEEEEINIDNIADIVEELVVDTKPVKNGWLATPTADIDFAEELELARRQSTEYKEKYEAMHKAAQELEESKKENDRLRSIIFEMKSKAEELGVINAKLLYTNRVLSSVSLNERQKTKIVEAISKVGSVEEAKVIYETLQSTVGTRSKPTGPKSLSEAVSRPSSLHARRRSSSEQRNPFLERMQLLAGINKK